MAKQLCCRSFGKFFAPIGALLFTASLSGCGPTFPPTAPVSGVVILADKPVEGAAVMFVPGGGGRPASGVTDASGKFELSTFRPGDGAILGEHSVSISKNLPGDAPMGSELSLPHGTKAPSRNLLPERYASPESSGLSAKVERDMRVLKFTLED